MLQFIKNLFGFGKKEVKTDVFVTTETPANSIVIPVGGKATEEVKEALAEAITSYKEEIKFDETTGEVAINKPKEELEKVISERLSEIEAKKVPVVEKKPAPKKTSPKKNIKQKEAEKAPVVEKKPKTPTKKTKGEKAPVEKKADTAKPAPKKDTKKGKK